MTDVIIQHLNTEQKGWFNNNDSDSYIDNDLNSCGGNDSVQLAMAKDGSFSVG